MQRIQPGMRAQLRIGTSGWNYRHWRGLFYPQELRVADWLGYYTTAFDAVEVNTTFYGQPRESTVREWVRSTPRDFRFAVKMSRFITHLKRLAPDDFSIDKFAALASWFAPKLGPVLVQLPPALAFDAARVDRFFWRMPKLQYALEARHPSWLTAEAVRVLTAHGVAWCIADSSVYRTAEAVTAPFVYLRFHGPGRMCDSSYDDGQLDAWARRIRRWRSRGLECHAYFNNDVHGYAVDDAVRLKARLATADEAGLRSPLRRDPPGAKRTAGPARPSSGLNPAVDRADISMVKPRGGAAHQD